MKVLYIDIPFINEKGGDKNRSRFLWNSISENSDADLLTVLPEKYQNPAIEKIENASHCFTLDVDKSRFWESQSIYHFSKNQIRKFELILRKRQYNSVILRFESMLSLGFAIRKILPDAKIIFDVDMLFSRIASLSWKKNISFDNRFYLFELIKLKFFEKRFFNKSYNFLFTNVDEMNPIAQKSEIPESYFKIIPNVMEMKSGKIKEVKLDYILFFGTLNSAANEDAFDNLCKILDSQTKEFLKKNNIKVRIVGKNITAKYEQFTEVIDIVGVVDDIETEILNALFILLPLRIASGTRTRILEAAAQKKAVISSDIGIEGLEFSKDEILIANKPAEYREAIKLLIHEPDKISGFGEALYKKSESMYSAKSVSEKLTTIITEPIETVRRHIAIITNRFYPEVGGAETNIFFQAKELIKYHKVSVLSPKRLKSEKWISIIENIKIFRMFDFKNIKRVFPNLKSDTFCPFLFLRLIIENPDVIQCFPALNLNNVIAFVYAKLFRKPIVLCSFDFLDYAGIIKNEGSINPDILSLTNPSQKVKFLLKRFNHIFAIAFKEIEFYKRFNENVSYSPVPIRIEEYSGKIENPKAQYNLDEDDFVFLCLGRISKIKGQDVALKAFVEILKTEKNVKLVFVGRDDYEVDFVKSMKKIIEEAGISNKVIFTGMIERSEVLGWLKYSDIHIIPVRFMNAGAVVVESWINETPVIQSDVVDPNLVVEEENGFNFKSENIEDLTAKMKKAISMKSELHQMGISGKALVEEKYTYQYLIKLYNDVYSQVLSGR